MSRVEFEGRTYDPNIVGPIQSRFTVCPETNRLISGKPIPAINFELVKSGVFYGKEPEDLQPAHIETATEVLRNIAQLAPLGVKIEDGVFYDRADNHGKVGEKVKELKTAIMALVEPIPEDEGSPKADFVLALRGTPLIKNMTIRQLRTKPFV